VKLAGQIGNSGFNIKNNVYVGSSGILLTGILTRNYYHVSGNTIKEITSTPLPDYSLTGSGFYASFVFESCHGINYSTAAQAGKTGDYNFYMAPYGPGYYQPPVGELPTMAEQTFGFSKVSKKQADDLNLYDYLKIFGLRISSKINKFIPCKNYNLTAFHEGITDCPITSQPAFKYSEIQVELAAGTYLGSVGGNIYNHNPIPSSYDRGVLVATTLYKSANPTGAKATKENQDLCFYVPDQDIKPIPYFPRGSSASSSNYVFGKCANLSEIDRQPLAVGAVDGHTNASVGNPKDIFSDGDLGQDASNYDQSIYWNFVFKNNHEMLPFGNTHEAAQMTQDNDQVREDYWWEHRECPENIDYLNHAFGNNINACPMNYLDVPYYAAIGKFGYFGTRFQDTWRKITNEFDEPVGWVKVWNISGDVHNAPTVFKNEFVKGPKDNSLYKINGSFSGVMETIKTGANGTGITGSGEYFHQFDIDFYVHSGVEPTAAVESSSFSGALLITDPVLHTGISWEYLAGANPGVVESYLGGFNNNISLDPKDTGVLCSVALHIASGRTTGNFFDNADLTLYYFNKKKYVDYPYVTGTGTFYQLEPDAEYYPHSQGIGASDYDSLVSAASVEKKYYDFAFSDRVLFLKLNNSSAIVSPEYSYLVSKIKDFTTLYGQLVSQSVVDGSSSALKDDFKVKISNMGLTHRHEDPVYSFADTYVSTGDTASGNLEKFSDLIRKYGSFKSNGSSIDTVWYDKIVNEKVKRISKNYYGAIANGSAVDLFPNNQVTFSFESSSGFANSDLVRYGAVRTYSKVTGKELPSVKKQYFSAGLSNFFELSGYREFANFDWAVNTLNNLPLQTSSFGYNASAIGFPKVTATVPSNLTASHHNFYFGYVNPRGCGRDNFTVSTNSYLELINTPKNGIWTNYAPETKIPPSTTGNSPFRKPWGDAGFNKVGKHDKNYSCFSPMFLQQPLSERVKLCQAPTFRIYAVDYHSITEDKMYGVYPEVSYWLRKIKTVNTKGENLYPLTYQWYRTLKSDAQRYLETKNTGFLQTPNPTGSWCCSEDGSGNSPECTVIRPKECLNMNGAAISSWAHSEDSVRRFMGVQNADSNYFYFCRVSGRFGWRDSEFASVSIDNTVRVEIATMNLCGGGGMASLSIAGQALGLALKNGYLPDSNVFFEQVKDTNWNDRNNCETVRHVGPEGMRGETRVYTPSTFVDARGKRVRSAHWKDFGSLSAGTLTLSIQSAATLYADRALPSCDRTLGVTWAGTPMLLANYVHRTHFEPAVLTDNTTFGVKANKLRNIGELYPPRVYYGGSVVPDWNNKNPGHHQFEANLGSIKKYSSSKGHNLASMGGPNGPIKNLEVLGSSWSVASHVNDLMDQFDKKIKLSGSKIITGPECGYVAPSLGRLMHFYVESFATYYLFCEAGGVKPKKVKNFSHIAGGLRTGRAGLQYNWLGKPNDARLKRVSMPGPYAFQWKVERHNRDRSGNGMPLSFWSYHHEERMDDLYDAAAVYGAVKKSDPAFSPLGSGSPSVPASYAGYDANGVPFGYVPGIPASGSTAIREDAAVSICGAGAKPICLRGASIGPDDGPKLGCGSIRWRASGEMGGDKPNSEFVKYMEQISPIGPDPFRVYGCSSTKASDCFYPCISLKYPEGFTYRGGKNVGYRYGSERHYLTSSISGFSYESLPAVDGVTPRIFRVDISPCSADKKDICNYLTPTAHIGIDTWPFGNTSNIQSLIASISNL